MEQESPKPLPLEYRPSGDVSKDECYRCGYELRGIANDHPCPECGLLAERSRRLTDELHNTRPRWLRKISRGVNLILLAIVLAACAFAYPGIDQYLVYYLWSESIGIVGQLGYGLAALVFLVGVIRLATPEGYSPSDRADRRFRIAFRWAACMPLLALTLEFMFQQVIPFQGVGNTLQFNLLHYYAHLVIETHILPIFTIVPLPMLLFYHLRSLAKRAHSVHLAEHCAIVGIGASASLLYMTVILALLGEFADQLGLDSYWKDRLNFAILLLLTMYVFVCLFAIWSIYLLIRFAISFRRASRQLNNKWKRDDLAAPFKSFS